MKKISQIVTIGLVQNSTTKDKYANLKKTLHLAERTAKKGAQIICLQELYRTKYFPQYKKVDRDEYAETIPGESTGAFSQLAKKFKVVIIVPIYEKDADGIYHNSAAVIDENGNLLETYRKIHIPHDPLFYEKNYFTQSDSGYKIYKTTYGTFAVLICYDQWFPEAARMVALAGADIIFYPTAIGDIVGHKSAQKDWHDAWETIMRGHAIANSVYIAAVNRTGREDRLRFWGQSFVADNFGHIIKRAKADKDEIILVKADIGSNVQTREEWGFQRNRRPDTYQLAAPTNHRQLEPEYFMPAEWTPHVAVWLAWPYDKISFPRRVETVEKRYCEIIKALSTSENVELIVKDEKMYARAIRLLSEANADLTHIRIHITDYADVWFRDYGPTFVINSKTKSIGMAEWEYNAYGNKFPELLQDNNVTGWMKSELKMPSWRPGIVMEGGSIDVNGVGTLLTTEQCLLNKNRNPHLTKNQIEQYLKNFLGVKKIIWLPEGIVNDHTDGHIDDIAKFTDEHTIVYAYEEDKNDPNYPILENNYQILKSATDQDEKPFKLVRLPMPHQNDEKGEKMPVSYVNFYISNKVVLVPTFHDPNDAKALEIIQSLFPARKIIGIDASDLIYGGGTIHCVTREQPKV